MKAENGIRNLVLSVTFALGGCLGQPAHADIMGGEEVTSQDPIDKSVVALYQQNGRTGALCTATLIARNIALTAAHCVAHGTQDMVVVFGEKISSSDRAVVRVVRSEVARAWKEKHVDDHDLGDIAVVQFEGKLPKGYHAARLAPKKLKLSAGQEVTLAGYGISNALKHTGAGTLRKTTVKIVQPDFGKTEMVLDQSRGSGACHGDSGGPAFATENGKLILLGVTNRSYPNGAPDDCKHQVVYAKVTAYRKWITETVKQMRTAK